MFALVKEKKKKKWCSAVYVIVIHSHGEDFRWITKFVLEWNMGYYSFVEGAAYAEDCKACFMCFIPTSPLLM